MLMKYFISLMILFLGLPALSNAGEIKIYANGNIRPILMEIGNYYQTRYPDWKVIFETGKVPELKEKLEAGAKGDVILGDEKLFQAVNDLKAVDISSQTLLFTNAVVAVADEDSEGEMPDPKTMNSNNFKKVALVSEKSPLGKLVRAYLEPLGLKNAAAEKKIEVKDPKAALEAVKTGEAKWTLVYSTDASKRKVKRLFQVPATSIPEISFSGAILNRSTNKEQAAKFLEVLQSTIGKKLFENAGFIWKAGRLPGPQTQTQTKPKTPKPKKRDKKEDR